MITEKINQSYFKGSYLNLYATNNNNDNNVINNKYMGKL